MSITIEYIYFQVLFLLIAYFAFSVVFSKNLIISLLMLALSFFSSAIVLLMLDAEMLALFIVIIYMGAIVILFLFSIMMLEYKLVNVTKNHMKFMYSYYLIFVCLWGYLIIFPLMKVVLFTESSLYYKENSSPNSWFLFINNNVLELVKGFLIKSMNIESQVNNSIKLEVLVFYDKCPAIFKGIHVFRTVNFTSFLDALNDYESYAYIVYSGFLLSFLTVGMILLLTSIGAVHLGKRFINNKSTSSLKIKQFVNKQLARSALVF